MKQIHVVKAKSRRVGYIRGGQRFEKAERVFPANAAAVESWPDDLGPCVEIGEDALEAILADPHIVTETVEIEVGGKAPAPVVTVNQILDALTAPGDDGFDKAWEKSAKEAMREQGKSLKAKVTAIDFTDSETEGAVTVAFKLNDEAVSALFKPEEETPGETKNESDDE
ncbi:MAG: hypothetical protein AAGK66_02685 [Pseudomonadota bacterium]